ncbi:MAG: PD-(D/E)XK nuclease family protein, partial [Betaproteobacteria bacterium]|nr:PD-(D/E)XK nuclease family protein [Betaproteobacteria bacterium]
ARIFARVLRPGFEIPGVAKAPMPFNISIGEAIDRYAVVALALSFLAFTREGASFEKISKIVQSPFLGGAEREMAARAKLEAKLRRKLDAQAGLAKLIANAEGAPLLRRHLEKVFELLGDEMPSRKPSAWARHFSAILAAAGFPGERTLDSEEFQALGKWHEMLGELARLDLVAPRMGFAQALATLRRLCAGTIFQPETPGEAPIQVLGALESAGLELEHLWVSGLVEEAWPLRAEAHPFISVAAQRKAGVPQASPEASFALDRRITEGWAGAAPEVVFSWFAKEEDRDLLPSALILPYPEGKFEAPPAPRLRELIHAKGNVAKLEDRRAPALVARRVRGGTRVLADQAACPFRAFARWRLAAEALEAPREGLDASDRGKLLHEFMAALWGELKGSPSLKSDVLPALERAAARAVESMQIQGRFSARFAELERGRLARLGAEWLELERTREPFSVLVREERAVLGFGPIELDARIDRIDRVGEGRVLIDYKTSRNPSTTQWDTPRPGDPQLPLYAVAMKGEVSAVAFAQVRPGQMRFIGYSAEEKTLPGVKPSKKGWKLLLREWKEEAERLAGGFAGGDALVDPKRGIAITCRQCDLQTLCRVYEKVNVLAEEEPEDADE